jgi:predicted nucleotide-binding protein
MAKRHRVFISYSHEDLPYAAQIRDALYRSDFDVWMDKILIEMGQSISSAIMEGLNQSSYYVLLISKNSNSSEWVKRENSGWTAPNRRRFSLGLGGTGIYSAYPTIQS